MVAVKENSEKFNQIKVDIEFINQPYFHHDRPYGNTLLKLDGDETIEMPNVVHRDTVNIDHPINALRSGEKCEPLRRFTRF